MTGLKENLPGLNEVIILKIEPILCELIFFTRSLTINSAKLKAYIFN